MTCSGHVSFDMDRILNKASMIKLAVFDVDGVLTNGDIVFTDNGEELKTFNVQDGLGLAMLKRSGCEIAIISARSSPIIDKRMTELGINHVYQGQNNKRKTLLGILAELGIARVETLYVGDDLIDIPPMRESGLAIAVANAHPLVKQQADWVSQRSGGSGAVREICELILQSQGKLDGIYNEYLQ